MKIDTDKDGNIVLKEIYSGVLLETSEGNQLGICMRDDTFEINILPKGTKIHCWHHVNMQTLKMESDAPVDCLEKIVDLCNNSVDPDKIHEVEQ